MPTVVLLRLANEEAQRELEALVRPLPRRALPRAVRAITPLALGVAAPTGAATEAAAGVPHGGWRRGGWSPAVRNVERGKGNRVARRRRVTGFGPANESRNRSYSGRGVRFAGYRKKLCGPGEYAGYSPEFLRAGRFAGFARVALRL